VVAAEPRRGFVQEAGSISDMLQYARDTWLELGPARRVAAQGELAELLDSAPGREWLAFSGVRRAGEGLAICTTEIWLDTAFAELEAEVGRTREALYQLVEERYGHATEEIQQRISATLLDEAQARALDARPGEPALRIVRRYFGTGGRPFEASISVHPADRFAYAMRIRRGG
jgi:GntR family transcriptional regulator